MQFSPCVFLIVRVLMCGCGRQIEEIRGRERLPIIVGGTHYYVQALLYPSLISDVGSPELEAMSREELAKEYPIL